MAAPDLLAQGIALASFRGPEASWWSGTLLLWGPVLLLWGPDLRRGGPDPDMGGAESLCLWARGYTRSALMQRPGPGCLA